VNFARDVVGASEPGALALIELTREGERREWTSGEVNKTAAHPAGYFEAEGLGRGDVVLVWLW
jgi:hypothetical protein